MNRPRTALLCGACLALAGCTSEPLASRPAGPPPLFTASTYGSGNAVTPNGTGTATTLNAAAGDSTTAVSASGGYTYGSGN